MSSLSACYRFVSDSLGRRVWLWSAVREEMKVCMGLFMILEAQLGAPFCRDVGCGDSSGYGYALLTKKATDDEIREAWKWHERWRYRRVPRLDAPPLWTSSTTSDLAGMSVDAPADSLVHPRLANDEVTGGIVKAGLGSSTAFGQWLADRGGPQRAPFQRTLRHERLEEVELENAIPPLEAAWANPKDFTMLVAGRWRWEQEHINLKEARVALMFVRRACRSRRGLGHRHLVLSDNLCTIGAFEKGRSSSWTLNNLCKRLCAYKLAGRLQLRFRYIESKRNVADEGSRYPERFRRPARADAPSSPTWLDVAFTLVGAPPGLETPSSRSWGDDVELVCVPNEAEEQPAESEPVCARARSFEQRRPQQGVNSMSSHLGPPPPCLSRSFV